MAKILPFVNAKSDEARERLPVVATFFRDVRAKTGTRVEGVDAIARAFERHAATYERANGAGEDNPAAAYTAQKLSRPGVVLGTFEHDARSKAALQTQSGVCIDVDKTSSRTCADVMRWLRARRLAAWVWATDSHMRSGDTGVKAPMRACMRVVIPFTHAVDPFDEHRVRAWLVDELTPFVHPAARGFAWLDRATLKPEQLNFTPRIGSGVAAVQGFFLDPGEVRDFEMPAPAAAHIGLVPVRELASGTTAFELPPADSNGRRLHISPRDADRYLRAVNAHVRPATDGSTAHVLAHRSSEQVDETAPGRGLQWRDFMFAMSSLYVEGDGKNWHARVVKAYKRACHAFGGFDDSASDASQWRKAVESYRTSPNPITWKRLDHFIEACGGLAPEVETGKAPRHPYIGGPIQPIDLAGARAKIADRLADASVAREVIAVPAGVGKSYATVRQALDDVVEGVTATFTSPTHELARQVERDLRDALPAFVGQNYARILASPLAVQMRVSGRWRRTPSEADIVREISGRIMRAPYRRDVDRTFVDGHVDAANCERTTVIQGANAQLDAEAASAACRTCTRNPLNGGACGYLDRVRSFHARQAEGGVIVRTTRSFMLTSASELDRLAIRISWAQIREEVGFERVPVVVLTPTGGRIEARVPEPGEQGHEVGEALEWLCDWSGADDEEGVREWAAGATWLHRARRAHAYLDEDPSSAMITTHAFDANDLARLMHLGVVEGDVQAVAGRLAVFTDKRSVDAGDWLAATGTLRVNERRLGEIRDDVARQVDDALADSEGMPDPAFDPIGYAEESKRFADALDAMGEIPSSSAVEALRQTLGAGYLGATVRLAKRSVDGHVKDVPVLEVSHVIRPNLDLFSKVKVLDASADAHTARALLGARLTRVDVERPGGMFVERVHGTVSSRAATVDGFVESRKAHRAFERALAMLGPDALVFGYKAWVCDVRGTLAGHDVRHAEWHNSTTARGVNLYENEDTVVLSSLHVPRAAVEHRARLLVREAAHKGVDLSEQHAIEAASFQLQTAPMIQEAYRIRPFTSEATRIVYFDTKDVPGLEPDRVTAPGDFAPDGVDEATNGVEGEKGVEVQRSSASNEVGTSSATCVRADTRANNYVISRAPEDDSRSELAPGKPFEHDEGNCRQVPITRRRAYLGDTVFVMSRCAKVRARCSNGVCGAPTHSARECAPAPD